jgi:hypothetical protein
VDHGCTEGTYAEIFTASLESAAFVEKDMNKLIQFGLTMIPGDCKVATAIKTALESKKYGLTWQEAREEVVNATTDLGWFQAPRNVAFTIIGWLYGNNDFGRSICIAINCGDDTDCTGATLGSIFGIIYGTAIIPEKWRAPIGDGIKTVAVSGFEVPATLQVLTDKTISAQKKVAEIYGSPVKITAGKTRIASDVNNFDVNAEELSQLWHRSPYLVTRNTDEYSFTCNYEADPEIREGETRTLTLIIENKTEKEKIIGLIIKNLPSEYSVSGLPGNLIKINPGSKVEVPVHFNVTSGAGNAKFIAEIDDAGRTSDLQLGLIKK